MAINIEGKKPYSVPTKYYNEAYNFYIYFIASRMPYSSMERLNKKMDTLTLVIFTKLFYETNKLDREVIMSMALCNIVCCNKTGDASQLCKEIDVPDFLFERAKKDKSLIELLNEYLYSHVLIKIFENNIVVDILEHKPNESIKFVLYGPNYKYKTIELYNLADENSYMSNITKVPKPIGSISRMIATIIEKELI